MASVYDTLYLWARKTTTTFADFLVSGVDRDDPADTTPGGLIYRLKHWPDLTPRQRTADVLRTLSVMSHRPVNKTWILASSHLTSKQVDVLLERLVEQGAVEVIDAGKFRPSQV